MTSTFQSVGEPWIDHMFSLKDKIYYEMVEKLLHFGRRYVPYYFIRGMTGYLLENYKHKDIIGAEIGTQNGYNAKVMLLSLPIKKLHCIDPYIDYVEDMGTYSKDNTVSDRIFKDAREYLSVFGDRVEFHRDISENVAGVFEDGSLDFVYIDGNHSYDFVRKDIELYLPKVKPGGILGGHDFGSRYGGVVHAVVDYTRENDVDLFTGRDADWWIIKE